MLSPTMTFSLIAAAFEVAVFAAQLGVTVLDQDQRAIDGKRLFREVIGASLVARTAVSIVLRPEIMMTSGGF
jgi:hypothetical protein